MGLKIKKFRPSKNSCMYMYVDTVSDSVMSQLNFRRDFYNIVFKMKHQVHTVKHQGQPPPPRTIEKFCVPTCCGYFCFCPYYD
jgi:hypothetical protein